MMRSADLMVDSRWAMTMAVAVAAFYNEHFENADKE
jgi:hypothetical protein